MALRKAWERILCRALEKQRLAAFAVASKLEAQFLKRVVESNSGWRVTHLTQNKAFFKEGDTTIEEHPYLFLVIAGRESTCEQPQQPVMAPPLGGHPANDVPAPMQHPVVPQGVAPVGPVDKPQHARKPVTEKNAAAPEPPVQKPPRTAPLGGVADPGYGMAPGGMMAPPPMPEFVGYPPKNTTAPETPAQKPPRTAPSGGVADAGYGMAPGGMMAQPPMLGADFVGYPAPGQDFLGYPAPGHGFPPRNLMQPGIPGGLGWPGPTPPMQAPNFARPGFAPGYFR